MQQASDWLLAHVTSEVVKAERGGNTATTQGGIPASHFDGCSALSWGKSSECRHLISPHIFLNQYSSSSLQSWTTFAGVCRTAPSSPTCLMATCQTCRNQILLNLHPLDQSQDQLRCLQARRESPSSPSHQGRASSAPSPMWWSRRPPRQDWSSKRLCPHRPKDTRSCWSSMKPSRTGKSNGLHLNSFINRLYLASPCILIYWTMYLVLSVIIILTGGEYSKCTCFIAAIDWEKATPSLHKSRVSDLHG